MVTSLSFGSLFSGIGGFDLALERAGMSCAWQVEIDGPCRSVLARHWPAVPRLEDVTHVKSTDLPAPVDLICGGFPCQDLSVAGRRAGLAGERSGLWFEFHRILAEVHPRWCLIENVPGLLSSNGGRDFAILLRGLVELGYGIAWRVLDAQYFGVAQRRRRVFIVGHLGDGRAAQVLFESEGVCGNPPTRREAGEGIAPSLAARAKGGGGLGTDTEVDGGLVVRPLAYGQTTGHMDESQQTYVFESRFARNDRGGPGVIVPPLKAQSGGTGKGDGAPLVISLTERTRQGGRNLEWQEDVAYALDNPGEGGRAQTRLVAIPDPAYSVQGVGSKFGSGRERQDTFVVAAPLRSRQSSPGVSMPGRGGEDDENIVVGPIAPNAGPKSHDAGNFHTNQGVDAGHIVPVAVGLSENQRAEVRLTDYSRQITGGGGKPGQGYPAAMTALGVRRLTPTECERLQGFPDGWTEGHADSSRYRMLGNAVCVPVAEWIGRRINRQ